MFNRVISIIKNKGFKGFTRLLIHYVFPEKSKTYRIAKKFLLNKTGLEVGGPSKTFSSGSVLPIYPIINSLDNTNFSFNTVWDGQLKEGNNFVFGKKRSPGYQYILDSTDMNKIPSGKYDFLICSHVLEHIANPVKALIEWKRVIKDDGVIIMLIPHKDGTFDHNREISLLSHIIEDYNNNVCEDDMTHVPEVLKLHDLSVDEGISSPEELKQRAINNFENRCLHHHVFNTRLAAELVDYVQLQILDIEAIYPCHIVIIARKASNYDNTIIFRKIDSNLIQSPFSSDQTK